MHAIIISIIILQGNGLDPRGAEGRSDQQLWDHSLAQWWAFCVVLSRPIYFLTSLNLNWFSPFLLEWRWKGMKGAEKGGQGKFTSLQSLSRSLSHRQIKRRCWSIGLTRRDFEFEAFKAQGLLNRLQRLMKMGEDLEKTTVWWAIEEQVELGSHGAVAVRWQWSCGIEDVGWWKFSSLCEREAGTGFLGRGCYRWRRRECCGREEREGSREQCLKINIEERKKGRDLRKREEQIYFKRRDGTLN